MSAHLEGLRVELDGLLGVRLLTLDVGEVVERVGVRGTEGERRVVAVLRLLHLSQTHT